MNHKSRSDGFITITKTYDTILSPLNKIYLLPQATDANAHNSATDGQIAPKIEPIVHQEPPHDYPHHWRHTPSIAMVVLRRQLQQIATR
jgi:hypothetical protein